MKKSNNGGDNDRNNQFNNDGLCVVKIADYHITTRTIVNTIKKKITILITTRSKASKKTAQQSRNKQEQQEGEKTSMKTTTRVT